MKPRDYQDAAVQAIFAYWFNGGEAGLIAAPTGTGKALIVAEICKRAYLAYPGTRIMMLSHVKELVSQNFQTLLKIWPTAPVGIYSAGLKRKDINKPIIFAGIGSVKNALHYFKPNIIIIDEAHSVSPKETTTYRKALDYWQRANPQMKICGLSATPYRLGQGMLTEPGGIFKDIVFDVTGKDAFNWFISEGYLKPLVPPRAGKIEYDISKVKISSTGDYNSHDLQAAVDVDSLNREVVAEMIEQASDREHWLVFCAGISHAEHITEILNENGIPAICIHSKSSDEDRDKGVKEYRAGKYRALVNNGVFTTGFDFPGIDYIAMLRHTTSPGLWVQMLGRGTRPDWDAANGYWDLSTKEGRLGCIAAGRPNCLVGDFARNTGRLGEINNVKVPARRGASRETGDVPAKVCPKCMSFNFTSARVCCQCGHEFPIQNKMTSEASTMSLIAESENQEPVEEWFEVDTVTYSKHTPWNGKSRGPFNQVRSSLRVTYNCKDTIRSFVEYVSVEHGDYARASAEQWWEVSGGINLPLTVATALKMTDTLKQPKRIRVWVNRKNPQIQYREF